MCRAFSKTWPVSMYMMDGWTQIATGKLHTVNKSYVSDRHASTPAVLGPVLAKEFQLIHTRLDVTPAELKNDA